jgi:LAO/AO transport system kinase
VSRGAELAERLAARDLSAAPAVLNLVESTAPADRADTQELLARVRPRPDAHVIGVTGPPGVGKSSLLSHLVAAWRAQGRSVAVLAVDPSSRRSGGSLLGDRARIRTDPGDRSVLVRSTAAGEQLGGLAPGTRAAAAALAAAFDVVVVETVGVGQSETDVAEVVDSVVVVVQPGSGDTLQFLKSGIMEIPSVLVVTKADLGTVAQRARRDLHAALRSLGARDTPVVATSATAPVQGIDELVAALETHRAGLDLEATRRSARRRHALADFVAEHGAQGLRAVGGRRAAEAWLAGQDPDADVAALVRGLEEHAG